MSNAVTTVLYFASVRQGLGLDQEQVSEDCPTMADLLAVLSQRSAAHSDLLTDSNGLRFAINQEFAELTDPIPAGAEVAIFPPVTGG